MRYILGIVIAIVVIAIIIFVIASYSARRGASPYATSSPSVMPSPTASTSPVTGQNTVTIQNFSFQPGNLMVAKGTTVTWTNNDTVNHTVTADGGQFESGQLTPGQTFNYTFSQAGTFPYHCSNHPYMKAQVISQ